MGMKMTEAEKEIFAEQIKVSTQAIQNLKEDATPEGTKEFYRHVAILKDIKARVDIIANHEKNIQEMNNVLSRLND
jgi:hypothetical protein